MPRKKPAGDELTTEFVTVFPVADFYLTGVPHVPTITTTVIAERLVRTGAFTYDAPEAAESEDPPTIEVSELAADVDLDFYDPPPVAADIPTEDPADAGSLDSAEV